MPVKGFRGALLMGALLFGLSGWSSAVTIPPALPKVMADDGSGGPSDATVKFLVQDWLEKSAKTSDPNSYARVASWDTPLRRGKKSTHTYYGIGEKTVYPVKVDFSSFQVHPTRIEQVHWKGNLLNFYKDDFGEWAFSLDESGTPTHDPDIAK